MNRFIEGADRAQSTLLPECLDDWVDESNPVRAVDAFVGALDLAELGFKDVEPAATGRPGYHPAPLLKLYIYGYLNRIQSSRRLEREARRNLEVIWLLQRLSPDDKTIADFRRDNGPAIKKVCAKFVELCRQMGLLTKASVAIDGSKFKAVNTRFIDNRCYPTGPDLGGGAIRALAQYQNRPVYITQSTFRGGRCSNGGALSSIQVQWNILNSQFFDNKAIGWGANPASAGAPGGGSGGAVYIDGKNNDVLIAGTIMQGNKAREGGGAVFDVVNTGWGALTFNQSHLHGNTSGAFQNLPGIYYELDGKVTPPVMINSTID